MLSLNDRPTRLCDGWNRREWLRVGGSSVLGLSLADLLRAESLGDPASRARVARSSTFGKARSLIFLWLQGGPPQHETFDPKPNAPAEIRGPFRPIATNVPGIFFSELLPRTAAIADKLAVVRSIATDDNNHDVSGYWVLTGYPYGPGSARQIKTTDWPYFGCLVKMLKPSEQLPALTSVWIPDVMRLNDNVTPAGQTAGFLGKFWEPQRFVGDPADPNYRIEGLELPSGVTHARIDRRRDLLGQMDDLLRRVQGSDALAGWDRLAGQAFDLATSGRARAAFDLSRESAPTRDRYGRHSWGQSVLLARRLVEAGVRLVHVNWTREPGDSAVDNPLWDTHAQNADRLQDALCPQFDVTFSTLIDDLGSRGLLDETLVVAIGEFGRTPRINTVGGRDHWGHVFSFVMAGAGISGGQVFGSSDKNGGYPTSDPIRPHDLTATIFHLLGIEPHGMFLDRSDRPHPLSRGEPLIQLLGDGAATKERRTPGGDPSFVPPYDNSLLLDTGFRSGKPLAAVAPPSRERGWRAFPTATASSEPSTLRVWRASSVDRGSGVLLGVGLRPGLGPDSLPTQLKAGERAILAQEIRNARGGQYTFHVHASGGGASAAFFDQVCRGLWRCQLVLFRYTSTAKDPREMQTLASLSFQPEFTSEVDGDEDRVSPRRFTLSKFLGSTEPGGNFPIGNGLGVAVVVEAARSAALPREPGTDHCRPVYIRVHKVELEFDARPRDETVTQ